MDQLFLLSKKTQYQNNSTLLEIAKPMENDNFQMFIYMVCIYVCVRIDVLLFLPKLL